MQTDTASTTAASPLETIVYADREVPIFAVGDQVRVLRRQPTGHYRVPQYARGKRGVVSFVLPIPELDNEQEGYGHNAGMKRHYYRVAFAMSELWSPYAGKKEDLLYLEIFETWLEKL